MACVQFIMLNNLSFMCELCIVYNYLNIVMKCVRREKSVWEGTSVGRWWIWSSKTTVGHRCGSWRWWWWWPESCKKGKKKRWATEHRSTEHSGGEAVMARQIVNRYEGNIQEITLNSWPQSNLPEWQSSFLISHSRLGQTVQTGWGRIQWRLLKVTQKDSEAPFHKGCTIRTKHTDFCVKWNAKQIFRNINTPLTAWHVGPTFGSWLPVLFSSLAAVGTHF